MSNPPSVMVGRIAGRYVVERQLGRGGTAVVYLARDPVRGESVAIKVLRDELVAQAGASHSFLREIRRHSSLKHPHILPVLDAGEHDGGLYIALPYMDGGTLRDRMSREKQLPVAEAVTIATSVAQALHYAHARGLIHRDVKPENILFSDGEACLADFGIARALETALEDSAKTTSGIVRGTMAYMSPEQASGEEDYDGRSDVYSLGCVLYEMLAGVPAFVGPTPKAALAQRFTHTPREICVYRPSVSPSLEAVVMKALQFAPADRFRTAGELADALSAADLEPRAPASLLPPLTAGSLRPAAATRRRVRIAAGAGLAAALLAVVALQAWWRQGPDRFRERDWVLVADFEGPQDDPELASSVRELATAELNQSRFLSTLPRSQLDAAMRLAGVPETTRVGPQLARELAYRSAVRAVLVGSVKRFGGDDYSIILNVVNADDGSGILTAVGAARDSSLITTVQRLARQIRMGLGERRSAIDATRPLEQVATASFPAYRKYIEAQRLQSAGDPRGSNRLLREALALDTGFASALMAMGWNYSNERMLDSARWAFRRALDRRTRLSDLDRYRLEGDAAYILDYDIEAALGAYDLYLAAAPTSVRGHNNRGNALVALGRYEDALASFERAADAHPLGRRHAPIQVMNLAATLLALRRVADADRAARDLGGPFALYVRLMRAVATDHWREADSLGTAVATAPSSPGWLRTYATAVAASGRAGRGAVRSADEMLAHGAAGAAPEIARWLYRARLLLAIASGQRPPPPPNTVAADTTAGGAITTGLAAALQGDTAMARRHLERVQSAPASYRRRLGAGPLLLDAWLQARSGDWRGVADLVGETAIKGEHDASVVDRVGSLSLRWLAAEAYARTGRLDSATAVLELAIQPERMPGNEFAHRGLVVTFARQRLAEWYDAAGRRGDASRHRRLVLETLTEPDPELAAYLRAQRSR